jgi:Uri superfamily endonuclease
MLFLELSQTADLTIGRLGSFRFPAGHYVYIGSALGSGGLRARVARHHRQEKRLHWHIDYLLTRARIVSVLTDVSGERLECVWVRQWLDKPEAQVVAPGFGASDCRCPTHLVFCGSNRLESRRA